MIKEVHGGNIYKYKQAVIDFSANINPLGMPKEVKKAIIDNIDRYESYPDPFNRDLIKGISKSYGINEPNICVGNGAADIIFRIALGLKPKKALIISPTFSEYEEALNLVNCTVEHFLLKEEEGFYLNENILDKIDQNIDILFLCNPNNPTGIPEKKELILKIAQSCKKNQVTLVVDECFSEFLLDEKKYSIVENLFQLEKVIVLKAFTKIYAMAGIRLGFCLCSDLQQADIINNTLQPWSVSTVASKAGIAALEIEGFVEETKVYIEDNRKYLTDQLKKLDIKSYDSKANYILFRGEENLAYLLEKENIIVRSCKNYITLDDSFYRIAVRTRKENEIFIRALSKIKKCGRDGGING